MEFNAERLANLDTYGLHVAHHDEGDWGVYLMTIDGPVRISGEWVFASEQPATARAWGLVAAEYAPV